MADKIQLTPAELMTQATQMQTLYDEFSSTFSTVSSVLTTINGGLSPNLAHNFLEKINSASKSFTGVLQMLEGGIRAAQLAAQSFSDIDSQLAAIFGGGGGGLVSQAVQEAASELGIDPALLSTLSPDMIARITEMIQNGDYSGLIESFGGGMTGGLISRFQDMISDATGLNVDITSTIDKIKHGDIPGALLDVADASVDIFNSAGGISEIGVATKFLLETAKIVTDPNSFANKDTDVYVNGILDAFDSGNFVEGVLNLSGYMTDVVPRTLLKAAGDTASSVIDGIMKNTVGISLSEINSGLEKTIGINPGKMLKDAGSAVGDAFHDTISAIVSDNAVQKAISNTASNIGKGIKKAGEGILKNLKFW